MIDQKRRKPGKYIEVFEKKYNNIKYVCTETTVVGDNYEIIKWQREFNPGIIYPMIWEKM